jgi:hypothetical protein
MTGETLPTEAQVMERLHDLLQTGRRLLGQRPDHPEHGPEYWVDSELIPETQAWLSSAANLVTLLATPGSYYREELARISRHDDLKVGASWVVVQKMLGLVISLQDEVSHGLVSKLEYMVLAAAFDDFLDHAAAFHKGNNAREAGVLAAVVLEDTIKRIATKNGVTAEGLSLEQLVDELVKVGVFTPVKAKRVKAYAGVRNPALHAEWDKFDIRDAGELIAGTRELIEDFL